LRKKKVITEGNISQQIARYDEQMDTLFEETEQVQAEYDRQLKALQELQAKYDEADAKRQVAL